MTKEERSERGRKAVAVRWARAREREREREIAREEVKTGVAVDRTDGVEEMVVDKVAENPNVLLCRRQDGAAVGHVWVKNNAVFTVGMELKCWPKEGMPGWFRVVGPSPGMKYSPEAWKRRVRAGLMS